MARSIRDPFATEVYRVVLPLSVEHNYFEVHGPYSSISAARGMKTKLDKQYNNTAVIQVSQLEWTKFE